LTSNRIFDEFLITPAGKRSFILPPSSSWNQQSLSSFSTLIGDSSTSDDEDEQDAAGDVEGISFLAIFVSSPLSLFSFDFLKD
jgi:hypothetical protein